MGLKYDAVLVLSCAPDENGNLTNYGISRLETAYNIFGVGETHKIALSGSQSQEMKKYLIDRGVFDKAIFLEDLSRDTIGNAVFSKMFLALPNRWANIAVVSSDFHFPRVDEVFGFVYGKDFKMTYIKAKSEGKVDFSSREKKSSEKFRETFSGIKPGDDLEIIARLFESHELYKNMENRKNLMAMLLRQL
ncbi:YdcF family protein [Candidatus Pacearchaeota archaeon]|nr:YdcF family protein [Candidatus Pacearchaeota archaeon]